jgi:hypothetical protein
LPTIPRGTDSCGGPGDPGAATVAEDRGIREQRQLRRTAGSGSRDSCGGPRDPGAETVCGGPRDPGAETVCGGPRGSGRCGARSVQPGWWLPLPRRWLPECSGGRPRNWNPESEFRMPPIRDKPSIRASPNRKLRRDWLRRAVCMSHSSPDPGMDGTFIPVWPVSDLLHASPGPNERDNSVSAQPMAGRLRSDGCRM